MKNGCVELQVSVTKEKILGTVKERPLFRKIPETRLRGFGACRKKRKNNMSKRIDGDFEIVSKRKTEVGA